MRPFTLIQWPEIPWFAGKAPVPIVACAEAVTEGKDPITALRKERPLPITARRLGHAVGHWFSTFQPPPSITKVTITFGGRPGASRPGNGWPSGAAKSNPIIEATEGATSARVTRSVREPGGRMPGA